MNECVILAVDPGEASGWAIWDRGDLVAHGPASMPIDRQMAVTRAVAIGDGTAPLIVVAEKWNAIMRGRGAPRLSTDTLTGLGAHWGRWLEQLDMNGGYTLGRSKWPKIARVLPTTWQPLLLGKGRSEDLKRWSMLRAADWARTWHLQPPADDNVADAICIGEWATKAPEVAALLPKRKAVA